MSVLAEKSNQMNKKQCSQCDKTYSLEDIEQFLSQKIDEYGEEIAKDVGIILGDFRDYTTKEAIRQALYRYFAELKGQNDKD